MNLGFLFIIKVYLNSANGVWKIRNYCQNIDEKLVIGGGRNEIGHRS